MGVQLNIKDAETVQLARKLANERGESVTAVIRAALERDMRMLDDERGAKVREALALVEGLRGRWKPEFDGMELSTRHGELLYDEDGVPR